jgi:cysteine desulfurase
MIYFDYNATSPVLPEVASAMAEAMTTPLNPSSVHRFGREAKAMVEAARSAIASMLGINLQKNQYTITFTSSATEANNLIMRNFDYRAISGKGRILVSSTEHISILKHKEYNNNIDILPVDSNGIISMQMLEEWLLQNQDRSNLVSIMLANNETGVIQPIKEIASMVHKYGAVMHSDCSQGPGKIKCDILDLGIDFASISAHKFGGPLGAGALIYKTQHSLLPQILGGGQERSIRAGTENVPAIVGFGVAAKNLRHQTSRLRDIFEKEITNICSDAIIFCNTSPRLPNTSMLHMPNVPANLQIISFDMKGVAVSSGSACSSGKVKISHVLTAMKVPDKIADCAIRFSFGPSTTEEDIVMLISAWREIYTASQVSL